MIIFLTGGARSGKSDFAQDLAEKLGKKRLYIASAQALDEEMKKRIENHQNKRGDRWDTLEAPIYLGKALKSALTHYEVILIDCLTLWMSNLLLEYQQKSEQITKVVNKFFDDLFKLKEGSKAQRLKGSKAEIPPKKNEICAIKTVIVISNEVGLGIVPDNPLARMYRDRLGLLNQRMAKIADEVYILFSGIPLKIKG